MITDTVYIILKKYIGGYNRITGETAVQTDHPMKPPEIEFQKFLIQTLRLRP
jgi:hypothetical protein